MLLKNNSNNLKDIIDYNSVYINSFTEETINSQCKSANKDITISKLKGNDVNQTKLTMSNKNMSDSLLYENLDINFSKENIISNKRSFSNKDKIKNSNNNNNNKTVINSILINNDMNDRQNNINNNLIDDNTLNTCNINLIKLPKINRQEDFSFLSIYEKFKINRSNSAKNFYSKNYKKLFNNVPNASELDIANMLKEQNRYSDSNFIIKNTIDNYNKANFDADYNTYFDKNYIYSNRLSKNIKNKEVNLSKLNNNFLCDNLLSNMPKYSNKYILINKNYPINNSKSKIYSNKDNFNSNIQKNSVVLNKSKIIEKDYLDNNNLHLKKSYSFDCNNSNISLNCSNEKVYTFEDNKTEKRKQISKKEELTNTVNQPNIINNKNSMYLNEQYNKINTEKDNNNNKYSNIEEFNLSKNEKKIIYDKVHLKYYNPDNSITPLYEKVYYNKKAAIRQLHEDNFKYNLKVQLKNKIESKIKKDEYDRIKENLKQEYSLNLETELELYNKEKINYYNLLYSSYVNNKNYKLKLKSEISNLLDKEYNIDKLALIEKKHKANYLRIIEMYKINIQKNLDTKYKNEISTKEKEISKLKSILFRLKYREKFNISKISNKSKIKDINKVKEKHEDLKYNFNNLANIDSNKKPVNDNIFKTNDYSKLYYHNNIEVLTPYNYKKSNLLSKYDESQNYNKNNNSKTIYQDNDKTLCYGNINKKSDTYFTKIHNNSNNSQLTSNLNKSSNISKDIRDNCSTNIIELNKYLKNNLYLNNNTSHLKSNNNNEKNELNNLISSEVSHTNTVKNYDTCYNEIVENVENKITIKNFSKNEDNIDYNFCENIKEKENKNDKEKEKDCLIENENENYSNKSISPNKNTSRNKILINNKNSINQSISIFECETLKVLFDDSNLANISIFEKNYNIFLNNEDNYRHLYYKEIKNQKQRIYKIFQYNKASDHCLTEMIIDNWNRLETSFEIRYKFLNALSNK